jgi:gluconate:H+ symporter, GntP family
MLFGLSSNTTLLLYAAIAVIGLIVLIAHFKLNSFLALIVASLFVGWASGMDLPLIAKSFQEGVGAVLGSIAIVIGLGTILGKMLAESGGAEVVSERLIKALGPKRLHWTMMLVAFIVGLPVFFSVGLVLLAPVVFTLVKQTRTPLIFLAIPLVAGLSVAHGLVPPHPGPMAAIGFLEADAGKTIFYSILIGLPVAMVAGPVFGKWISRIVSVDAAGGIAGQLTERKPPPNPPGFALTVFTILLPVLLMMFASLAEIVFAPEQPGRHVLAFVGSPVVALSIAVLFSFYSFGAARGYNRAQILQFSNDCLGPVALVLLVVGAGGGFNRVLVNGGVGDAIAELAANMELSPLIFGWVVAALIRIATGSATVAITTAAGIVAPMVAVTPGINLELLVIAMGAGSLILSHVNDGGFWLVKEYFNLTVIQTLKTWTVMETIIAVLALAGVLVLDALLR